MKILNRSHKVSKVDYYLIFDLLENIDSFYRYPCDEDGNVLVDQLNSLSIDTYEKCTSGDFLVAAPRMEEVRMDYSAAAIGECQCGEIVVLDSYGNICPNCGIEYDIEGSKLLIQRTA